MRRWANLQGGADQADPLIGGCPGTGELARDVINRPTR